MIYEKIKVVSTHDGDTTTLEIDIFINRQFFRGPVRLLGVNAPEITSKDPNIKEMAIRSRDYLARALGTKRKLKAEIKTDDKYGRPLAIIHHYSDGRWVCINDLLIAKGYADKISLAEQRGQVKKGLGVGSFYSPSRSVK